MADENRASFLYERVRKNIAEIVIGQDDVIKNVMITLLCDSHAIIVGVPGLAKTLIVKLLAGSLGYDYKRIQFTPDLMPSDITGTVVLRQNGGHNSYEFIKGPVFTNILLADEINRTPPKTQSALLQSMEERFVTNEGVEYPLLKPFNVFATQNPIEQEGTYPLPEAQLDRFMFQIDIGYPKINDELMIISNRSINEEYNIERSIASKDEILKLQALVKDVPVASNVINYVLSIVRNSRPEETSIENVKNYIRWGASPRAGIFLLAAVRAKALIEGRLTPDMDDVRDVAPLVLKHRLILSFKGEMENRDKREIVDEILKKSF